MRTRALNLLGVLIGLSLTTGPSIAHPLPGSPRVHLDLKRFELHFSGPTNEILKFLGPPQAHYHRDNQEYWLYGNVIKTDKETKQKLSAELIIRNGKGAQITWIPTTQIKKSIAIAKTFHKWLPPKTIKEKSFFLKDTNAVGFTKTMLLKKFGEPDGKWVFSEHEVWQYQKVRQDKKNPQHSNVLFYFYGDKVIYSR